MVAEDLRLEFARRVLQVSSTGQDRGDFVVLIVDTFNTAWRFMKLSYSRCVTLCPASQAVVVAALCGLENFVSFIRSKVGVFPHHFEWFYKILEETKKFMVQAATVCRVSDSVLQLFLKDPRVFSNTTKSGKLHPKSFSGLRLWKTWPRSMQMSSIIRHRRGACVVQLHIAQDVSSVL